jgi:hypothetical protein
MKRTIMLVILLPIMFLSLGARSIQLDDYRITQLDT